MKSVFVFVLFIVISSSTATSQAQNTFNNLESCWEYALEHHLPTLQNKEKINVAHLQQQATQGALLPQIKTFANLDYYYALPVQLIPAEVFGGAAGTYRELRFGTDYTLNLTAELSLPIVNFSLWNNLKQARAQSEIAQMQYELQTHLLKEQIAKWYYLSLLARYALDISEQNLKSSDTLYQNAQKRYAEGSIEKLELNRIQALQLQASRQKNQNEWILQQNQTQLKLWMGIPAEENTIFSEELNRQLPTLDNIILDYQTAPEYRLKLEELALQSLLISTEKQKRLPEIALYARYTQQAQRNQFDFFEANKSWFNIGLVGMRIDIPIFAGFQKNKNIKKVILQEKITTLQKEQIVLEQKSQNHLLAEEHKKNTENLLKVIENYQLSEENYHIAQLKYEQGLYSVDQLITLYQEQSQAQNDYLKHLADFWATYTQIEINK